MFDLAGRTSTWNDVAEEHLSAGAVLTLTFYVGSQGRWPGRDVVAHGAVPAPGVLDEGDRNCIVDILVTSAERQVSRVPGTAGAARRALVAVRRGRRGTASGFQGSTRLSSWFARTQQVPFDPVTSDPSTRSSSQVGGHLLVRQAAADQGAAVDPGLAVHVRGGESCQER